jgi:hypothetical protein
VKSLQRSQGLVWKTTIQELKWRRFSGNSPNDTFVVYNSSDVVVPTAGSHDVVYAAVSYTLPTGVDVLILEASAATSSR